MGCTTPTCPALLGNESWEAFVAQHQTPLTLDHSCRAIDVIRQRGGGGGAGSQKGAGGRTQPRAISSASLCSVSRAVSSGVSWVPDSEAWGPERKASRVRSKTGRPRSIRTSAAMFHSWLGCFGRRLPIAPGLGRGRLETTRARWGLAKPAPAVFLQDAFPVGCSTRAPGPLR